MAGDEVAEMRTRSMRTITLTLLGGAVLVLGPISSPACPSKEDGRTAPDQNKIAARAESASATQTGCETWRMSGAFPLGVLALDALIEEVTGSESSEWLSAETLSSRPWVMRGLMRAVSAAATLLGEAIGDDEVAETKADPRQASPPFTSSARESSTCPLTPRA
jgi:hypothetical protein